MANVYYESDADRSIILGRKGVALADAGQATNRGINGRKLTSG